MSVRCTFCDAFNPPDRRNCVSCGAELPGAIDLPPPAATAEDLEAEVIGLARNQGIIAAIKCYRDATGVGLAEAKAAVEALVAGASVVTVTTSGGGVNEAEILAIVREQGKIAAIKRYRELTGQGLKEAKDAVEEMMARNGVEPGRSGAGCGSYVFATLLMGIALWVLATKGF